MSLSAATQQITDRFLMRFAQPSGSLQKLKNYAAAAEDAELAERIRVVESFGPQLPTAITQIRSLYTADQARAHYILTTAHKSKGLEFRTVVLHPDLELPPNFPREEANLLYVATTRAKVFLYPNATLESILRKNGVSGVRMMSAFGKQGGPLVTC